LDGGGLSQLRGAFARRRYANGTRLAVTVVRYGRVAFDRHGQ
jgi:hypothetical protein